jgi:aspartate/glutamate racemase
MADEVSKMAYDDSSYVGRTKTILNQFFKKQFLEKEGHSVVVTDKAREEIKKLESGMK